VLYLFHRLLVPNDKHLTQLVMCTHSTSTRKKIFIRQNYIKYSIIQCRDVHLINGANMKVKIVVLMVAREQEKWFHHTNFYLSRINCLSSNTLQGYRENTIINISFVSFFYSIYIQSSCKIILLNIYCL